MRMITTLVFSVLLVTVLAAPTHAQSNFTNLVACWDMEEASGTRYDATANSLDLTDNNTVSAAAGLVGSAAVIQRASNEYLSHTDNDMFEFGSSDFTISLLVKMPSIMTGYILDKSLTGTKSFSVYNSSFGIRFYWSADGTSTANVTGPYLYADDAWHHVVVTRSGNYLFFYMDGAAAGTGSILSTIYNGTSMLTVAGYQMSTALDGVVDTLAIWNGTALTAGDIAWLYNSGAGRSCAEILATNAPTPTPTPTPTATPTATPTQTPTPTFTVYDVQLPSGGNGRVQMSVTAGEAGSILALGILAVLEVGMLITKWGGRWRQ